MEIHVNGQSITTFCRTLAELIDSTGLEIGTLIVEVNMHIASQEQWPTTMLADGDRVELLSFVGGG